MENPGEAWSVLLLTVGSTSLLEASKLRGREVFRGQQCMSTLCPLPPSPVGYPLPLSAAVAELLR